MPLVISFEDQTNVAEYQLDRIKKAVTPLDFKEKVINYKDKMGVERSAQDVVNEAIRVVLKITEPTALLVDLAPRIEPQPRTIYGLEILSYMCQAFKMTAEQFLKHPNYLTVVVTNHAVRQGDITTAWGAEVVVNPSKVKSIADVDFVMKNRHGDAILPSIEKVGGLRWLDELIKRWLMEVTK